MLSFIPPFLLSLGVIKQMGMMLKGTVEGAFRFTKKERINLPQDFRRVMKSRRRVTSKNFILFIQENRNVFHRLGIVVKKEVGPATFRNRIKRYIREFFRLHKHRIEGSFDIVLLVKKGCLINRYKEVEEELRGFFIR
jgi:ribonuclease P protein component